MSSGVRWVLFGLLGLLVAGAVAFLAIQTVSEKIGISSESPAAGGALAPPPTAKPSKKASQDHGNSSTTTVKPEPTPALGQTAGDYEGGDEGDGGGDDD